MLFEEAFCLEDVMVKTYGNALSGTASLSGLGATELRRADLDCRDRDYELVIGARDEALRF